MSENIFNNDVKAEDLNHLDDAYKEADGEDSFESVPDGKYQVNVARVELARTKTNNDPMLRWELDIISGEYERRKLFKNTVLAKSENVVWLKKELNKCGLKIEKVSDLPANLHKLLDVKLEITKRTSGENENIYFTKRIETVPQIESDDIPF